jgi:hypothetical protein
MPAHNLTESAIRCTAIVGPGFSRHRPEIDMVAFRKPDFIKSAKGPTFSVYKRLYTVITVSFYFYFARGSKWFIKHFLQGYKVFFAGLRGTQPSANSDWTDWTGQMP